MASEKSKLAKANLKTSLYFAGSITFATVAVGAAVSIPVYLEIKNSLANAIEQFSNLSKYLSQLAQKLGLPDDSEFEQELANGYVAVYTPEGGTKVYKEVNGKKVLVMNTNTDGTVKTAASFEGVEALTMLTAIDSAKEAFDNETEAMASILDEYSDAIDDSSYLTESITTSTSVALLILRDELATYNVDTITPAQELEVVTKTNDKLNSGIAARNNLVPDHVDQSDVSKAIQIIKDRREQIKLDEARAANALTVAQKATLEQQQKEHQVALEKAQKDLADIKEKQVEASASAAQKVAVATQTKVIEKAESNPGANASFIFANTSTFQKWFALLGATFGNVIGNDLKEQKPSISLREPIASQLEKNGLEEDKFLNLKDSLMEILGLENHKSDWKTTKEPAHKKIMTVTPILNTFANTKEATRVIIFDIKVNDIDANKIDDYFLLAHPSSSLAYDFEEYSIIGEDMGAYKGDKGKFDMFVQTITQLSLIASSKTLQPLNELAFTEILEIIEELYKGKSADVNKIKLTNNAQIKSKLEDFIRLYANDEKTNGVLEEFAKIIFESNFKTGGSDITFEAKELNDLIRYLIEKDGFNPSSNLTAEEIYEGYEGQPLMEYVIKNITKMGNDISLIKNSFEDNWNSFAEIGNANEIKNSNPELIFDTNIQRLLPKQDKAFLKDVKDLLSIYQTEFVNLLKQNPTDLAPFIKHLKFVKTLNLDEAQMKKILPLALDSKLFNKFDELETIASNTIKVPGTTIAYQDGIEKYAKSEFDAFISQINIKNSPLQKYIEQFNWILELGLTNPQYNKLKPSMFDSNLFAKFDELLTIFNLSGNVPNTNLAYRDEVIDFIKTNIDELITQINNSSSKLQTFIENFAWVRELNLDAASFDKINILLTDEQYFDTWKEIITLANDATWTPKDSNDVTRTGIEAIKDYFTKESDTLKEQFKNNIDIMAIKESIRYTFKGVNVSDPKTQARIDAAKDVAKDLDNIPNLDAAAKTAIQGSVENVITAPEASQFTKDEFDTIMKYTQTVFKLFPTHQDAVKQLQEVLKPTELVANGKEVVRNIATLNRWVDEIAKQNPNTTITLAMIREHAWKEGVIGTTYVNGDPNVDVVKEQSETNHLLLAGAQLTSGDKVMTIGSFMWGLWELEHLQGSNQTKISPIGSNTKLITDNKANWASAPYYLDGKIYSVPLQIAKDQNIHAYDVTNGDETIIPIKKNFDSTETRTALVVQIGTKTMVYGMSNNQYFDEYNISISNPSQSHIDYSKGEGGFADGANWFPTWTAGHFKIENENYIAIPVRNKSDEYALSMWHIEQDGHLKFVNLAKFADGVNKLLKASITRPDPTDATKTVSHNSNVWSNALVSGDTNGKNASLFMLGGDGKLWNFQFKDPSQNNNQFVIDETKSGMIFDSETILPQVKPDPNDKSKTTEIPNPWRGMTYNQSTHEINIFGITGAIYIPNQNKNINDIYNKLLT